MFQSVMGIGNTPWAPHTLFAQFLNRGTRYLVFISVLCKQLLIFHFLNSLQRNFQNLQLKSLLFSCVLLLGLAHKCRMIWMNRWMREVHPSHPQTLLRLKKKYLKKRGGFCKFVWHPQMLSSPAWSTYGSALPCTCRESSAPGAASPWWMGGQMDPDGFMEPVQIIPTARCISQLQHLQEQNFCPLFSPEMNQRIPGILH